jgi:hypothetical protein
LIWIAVPLSLFMSIILLLKDIKLAPATNSASQYRHFPKPILSYTVP